MTFPAGMPCAYCGHRARHRIRGIYVCGYHIDLPLLEWEAARL